MRWYYLEGRQPDRGVMFGYRLWILALLMKHRSCAGLVVREALLWSKWKPRVCEDIRMRRKYSCVGSELAKP
jgi:hypothetical protein